LSDSVTLPAGIEVGAKVIYAAQKGTFEYEGPTDCGSGDTITFGLAVSREHPGVKCDPGQVAPADTPIPAKDDRVTVVKRPMGTYPTWHGPWLLFLADVRLGYHRTKRDATAEGLRRVAIADWHAAREAAAPVG